MVLALTTDGRLTECTAPEESRGKGRCNHLDHKKDNETIEIFLERVSNKMMEENLDTKEELIFSQEDINNLASKIDKIAGCKVTIENIDEVMSKLSPNQINEINRISFEAAQEFELPITNDNYGEKEFDNQLYFASMPDWGIAGKKTAMEQMFVSIGGVPGYQGKMVNIEGNYLKGLNPNEYFEKLYSARAAQISKSVSTSLPGYTSRKMFYGLSDIEVKEDCNNKNRSIFTCAIPGGICKKCLESENINHFNVGDMIGGNISTNASQQLTELSMKSFHSIFYNQNIELFNKNNIKWENLEINNKFIDGSIVINMSPWEYKKCYKLESIDINGNKNNIIISWDHLINCIILDNKNNIINNSLIMSNKIRSDMNIKDKNWLCAQDLYLFTDKINKDYKLILEQENGNYITFLNKIELYKNGIPQKVRCIETNTGQYKIDSFLNHNTGGKDLKAIKERDIIYNTYDGFKNSPIIEKMLQEDTTLSRREVLFNELKNEYSKNNLKIDDYNLKIIAKKMTSYKRDINGLRYVKEDELCDIVSLQSIGNSFNPYKKAELISSYNIFTTPQEFKNNKDSAIDIIFN